MLLLIALIACAPEEGDGVCIHDPPLEYDTYGQGFLEQFCNGCHSSQIPEPLRNGAPLGCDFDSYGLVLDWRDRIRARTEPEGATMPPGGGATVEQLDDFREWLDCSVARDYDVVHGGGE